MATTSSTAVPAAGRMRESGAPIVGAVLVHVGFLALAISAAWTTQPLPETTVGQYERPFLLLVGVVLVLAALVGRRRLAEATAGKLLCALGAALCLSHALTPTFESIPAIAAHMPVWMADAYPGLATVGWIVAALGALVWWGGGGVDEAGAPCRRVAVVCAVLLVAVAWGTRRALVGGSAAIHPEQPYEIPAYQTALIIWHIIQTGAVLVAAMWASGQRRFGAWPLLLFGLALAGHAIHSLMAPPPS